MNQSPEEWFAQFNNLAQEAVLNAVEEHRRMGRSIVVWQDGRVVRVPPSQLTPRALPGDEIFDAEAAPIK